MEQGRQDKHNVRHEMPRYRCANRFESRIGKLQAVEYGPIVLARDENTDANYNAPVKFVTDDAGTMNITPVKPLLAGTRMEFEVPTANGKIRMSDYSSVNCWQGKKICTWIPRVR